MKSRTVVIGFRIPKEKLGEVERARRAVGATTVAELARDALRHYLEEISSRPKSGAPGRGSG